MTDETTPAAGLEARAGPSSTRYLADRFEFAAPGDQQQDVWLLRFCDKDCGDAIFEGPDAEREAWEAWERYSPAWNIYLFRLARLNARNEADTQHAEAVVRAVAEEREACSSLLRSRARKLRTAQGRVAAQWHKLDADMVAGELDRQAAAIRGRT